MRSLALVLVALLPALAATAQIDPSTCVMPSDTGTDATVVVPLAAEYLTPTQPTAGDTVATVTADGRCVGVGRFNDARATFPAAGPSSFGRVTGYAVGDTLRFLVRDVSEDTTYNVGPRVRYTCDHGLAFCRTDGLYAVDALYVLDRVGTPTPIPVELASFTARADGSGAAVLRWALASETNNAAFRVETHEGDAWRVVWRGAGGGTTDAPTSYTARLDGLAPGDHRFRLRQVDTDGTTTTLGTRTVRVGLVNGYALSDPAPNPTTGRATLTLVVDAGQRVRAVLFDVLGRRRAVIHDAPTRGGERVTLTVEASAPGVYYVQVTGETFAATRRVVVVR